MYGTLVLPVLLGAAFAACIDIVVPELRNVNVEAPKDHETPRLQIINGEEVVPHSIPYQVYLNISNGESSYPCGGSLITTKYVLTAAHCLYGASYIRVTLGAHDLLYPAVGSITVNSRRITVHEDYNFSDVVNDIGIIELDKTIALSENIQLARLPSSRDIETDLEGKNARVSGWGITNDESMSNILLQVNNTIISNKECSDFFNRPMTQQLCLSGNGNRSSCSGDSGGPLVIENIQYGIVSYGTPSCTNSTPTVFVRVTYFLNWIQNHSNWILQ